MAEEDPIFDPVVEASFDENEGREKNDCSFIAKGILIALVLVLVIIIIIVVVKSRTSAFQESPFEQYGGIEYDDSRNLLVKGRVKPEDLVAQWDDFDAVKDWDYANKPPKLSIKENPEEDNLWAQYHSNPLNSTVVLM